MMYIQCITNLGAFYICTILYTLNLTLTIYINLYIIDQFTVGCANIEKVPKFASIKWENCKGRTIRYLRGGWAITKKKFAHRNNPEKKYRAQQTY
jgi:hypothetical protein